MALLSRNSPGTAPGNAHHARFDGWRRFVVGRGVGEIAIAAMAAGSSGHAPVFAHRHRCSDFATGFGDKFSCGRSTITEGSAPDLIFTIDPATAAGKQPAT
jgi:hypothetical protein